ncbi:hypothetical protein ACHAXR_006036 [Thalassiosira sp. AJA248-18]
MPFSSVFGLDLNWALRDAISYGGSYGQIYRKLFGSEIAFTMEVMIMRTKYSEPLDDSQHQTGLGKVLC